MFCKQCGTENSDGQKFCSKCGAELGNPKAKTSSSSRVATFDFNNILKDHIHLGFAIAVIVFFVSTFMPNIGEGFFGGNYSVNLYTVNSPIALLVIAAGLVGTFFALKNNKSYFIQMGLASFIFYVLYGFTSAFTVFGKNGITYGIGHYLCFIAAVAMGLFAFMKKKGMKF